MHWRSECERSLGELKVAISRLRECEGPSSVLGLTMIWLGKRKDQFAGRECQLIGWASVPIKRRAGTSDRWAGWEMAIKWQRRSGDQ